MIKKGSTVEIISGKNKKKQGEVIEMDRSNYRAKVKDLNIIKKHVKTTKEKKGGIFDKENFIHLSNMKLIWIMGSDNLFNFSKWHKAQKISNLIPVAVFNRSGNPLKSINSKGAYVLGKRINSSRLKFLAISEPPIWGYFHNVNINISSTIIRGSKE